jgi:glycosyltransferase involved in cell wall biosynthesis
MKIVMVCEFYNDTLEYQENLLVKYYTKHNHQVTVITSTFESVFDYYSDRYDKNVPSREYFQRGAKIIKLQFSFNINRLKKYTSIYKILEREKPDLIYIHDIMLNILEAAKYVKLNPGCKMIMDYHADYSNSANNWLSLNILHKIIRKKIYLDRARKYISKIFPIVPASTEFLHEVYKVPYNQMELLPLGADTDYGEQVRRNGEGLEIRNRYNISPQDVVIFTGGKLQPAKKTELLIKAFLEINDERLHLFIVGKSNIEDEEYMNSLLKLSANTSKIHFTGWIDSVDIYKYLNASDLAVFPASQSILWQQAISMDLPLIAGNTGHQSIDYLNEFNSIVILEKNEITIEKIAENILRLINDKPLFESMKIGAQKATEKYLNWDKLILKTLQFNS